jgi:hypothetical protein
MRPTCLLVLLVSTAAIACAETGAAPKHAEDAEEEERSLAFDVAAAARIRANLTALRARAGRPPAGTFAVAEPLLRHARLRILAGHPPDIVLDDELQLAADNGERDIRYWSVKTVTPDTVRFPDQLVRSPRLNVAIVVVTAPAEPPDVPATYVLFAMAEPDQSSD